MTEPTIADVVTPLERLPMTKALKTLLANVTGKPWEIASIPTRTDPDDANRKIAVEAPFGILYPLWRVYSGPAFHSPEADVEWVYQATYAGLRGDQIEFGDDRITRAIVGRNGAGKYVFPLEVPGMYVMERRMRDENGDPGAGDVNAELLTRDLRFSIKVTPYRPTP